ncbi:MAG: phosphoribosylaminoimidazolesuccinocarboxamide synthase [Clostridia bacterium]|nr:phosphoribosylaminoimidazolesuccinocarboxamide synthase [Clostridia bacterium]
MEKMSGLIYEGGEKQIFAADDPSLVMIRYTDDTSAYKGFKKGVIPGKGKVNNMINSSIFMMLEENGIRTHFVRRLNERDSLNRRVEIIPVNIIVRNAAAGSLLQRLGLTEGAALACPVIEYCYKSDALSDPMINRTHVDALGLATKEELDFIEETSLRVNELLKAFFEKIGVLLIDFRMEFGRCDGGIVLADEISPDTCRLWDSRTGEKLDKDRFRRDLGDVENAYQEILRRMEQGGLIR